MAYTDALNGAIDSLTTTLTAVTGLRVVNDPTKLVPNCVYIDAPSFTTIAGNGNIIRMDFPITVIGSGPAVHCPAPHPRHHRWSGGRRWLRPHVRCWAGTSLVPAQQPHSQRAWLQSRGRARAHA